MNASQRRTLCRAAAVASGIPLGDKKQDQMIDLIFAAIGAPEKQRRALEKLAVKLLTRSAGKLLKAGRAPASMAELAWEGRTLGDMMRQRRSSRGGRKRGYIPQARVQQHSGIVDLVGKGGYSLFTEIAKLLNLSKDQVKRAREFIGRPLGKLSLTDANGNVKRVVDLAEWWDRAAQRSGVAQRAMKRANQLMDRSDALLRDRTQALQAADQANRAGKSAVERELRQKATKVTEAAERLRQEAYAEGAYAYERVRPLFWGDVHADAQLCEEIESMGLTFTMRDGKRTGVPYFKIGSSKERMTMEHFSRKSDDPRRAIDSANLIPSPTTENVEMNEAIRKFDRFYSQVPSTLQRVD